MGVTGGVVAGGSYMQFHLSIFSPSFQEKTTSKNPGVLVERSWVDIMSHKEGEFHSSSIFSVFLKSQRGLTMQHDMAILTPFSSHFGSHFQFIEEEKLHKVMLLKLQVGCITQLKVIEVKDLHRNSDSHAGWLQCSTATVQVFRNTSKITSQNHHCCLHILRMVILVLLNLAPNSLLAPGMRIEIRKQLASVDKA